MLHSASLAAVAALACFSEKVFAEGLYSKSSPVLQVDSSSYDRLIARSNHTAIVEFYAPWCGHCQNLKPAYEKAANKLNGLAKVAAVNCDDDSNKAFCGTMGVQGFPTLKIVRPAKKGGKPIVEEYQGPRSAKAIVENVLDKIPNHVKRIADKDLDSWLQEKNDTAKAILFTEKGTVSATMKALAVDFLGSISVAQIRNKEQKANEMFGITSYPRLVLLPGGDKDGIVYEGETKKDAMVAFLSQVAPPNPDPAPAKSKSSGESPKDKQKPIKAKDSPSSKSSAADSTASSSKSTQTKSNVSSSPPALPSLTTGKSLRSSCLSSKSGMCFLLLQPLVPSASPSASPDPSTVKDSDPSDNMAPPPAHDASASLPPPAATAVATLADISRRHSGVRIYALPADNAAASPLRDVLGIREAGDPLPELIAVNAKKGWWKRFEVKDGFGRADVEGWLDGVRMGEGEKKSLPEGVVVEDTGESDEEGKGKKGDAPPEGLNIEDILGPGVDLPSGLKVEMLDPDMLEPHDEL